MGIEINGYPSFDELRVTPGFPSEERIHRGPVAVIECVQEIPCDPCAGACPRQAIRVGVDITVLPELIEDRCNGCGSCIAVCPGQAIFMVDINYSETEALVAFPYEYVPLPQDGEIVKAVNRDGTAVTTGRVVNVKTAKAFDHTAVISLAIHKDFVQHVRSIMKQGG